MTEFVDRIKDEMREEIRVARGVQDMHRERYLDTCRELREAQTRGDFRFASEIAEYLCIFADEMWHIMQDQHSSYVRLAHLASGGGFTNPVPDATDPTGGPS